MRTLANRAVLAAKRATVLFVVEDAHWIDPSTNELLRDIVLRIHGAPVYVLVTYRPDWSPDWAKGLSQVTNVAVGRLNNQQIRLFIRSILGGVSDRLVDRIAERTDGVPLFVEELTRSILESGSDANEDIEIPDSLQGSLMARLDRLSATSKEVAQVAAVIGREFDRGLLGQVAALEAPILDDALSQLLAAQLVVMGGTSQQSLLFRHALIQDAAYQSLLTRKRVHLSPGDRPLDRPISPGYCRHPARAGRTALYRGPARPSRVAVLEESGRKGAGTFGQPRGVRSLLERARPR